MSFPVEESKIPAHVGIIMDGNGRWAKLRGKKRTYGHKYGSDNVHRISDYAFSNGIKVLTLYAFSTENWSRPKEEVDELMRLLKIYLKKFIKELCRKKVRLNVIGDKSVLTQELKDIIKEGDEKTGKFTEHVLNVAINYGGRQEIVKAVNEMLENGEEITADGISNHLYTSPFGEPDLIIRTGGELRLSNFLTYQGAYSELYFTDTLWPDFDEKCLDLAVESYAGRDRRFGGVK